MRLGKITSSESHLQYNCQIYSQHEVESAPRPDDYGLGNYVTVPLGDGRLLVGIIYDTRLYNPDFGAFSPRLSSEQELPVFSPDYVADTRTLVNIIVVGYLDVDGSPYHDAPQVAPLVNTEVHLMNDAQIRAFHQASEEVKLGYLPLLIALARTTPIMTQTILRILQRLQQVFPDGPASMRLRLVRQNLSWQFRVLSMP
ncbi:MAG: hypothetical protein ACUVWR_06955 [Anaerolineae bacterium]